MSFEEFIAFGFFVFLVIVFILSFFDEKKWSRKYSTRRYLGSFYCPNCKKIYFVRETSESKKCIRCGQLNPPLSF